MLLEQNQIGNKEDWAEYVTLADEHETPLLRMLPKGPKPVRKIKHYQFDAYSAPRNNPWPDGKDWDSFDSAGMNRQEMQARIQWFVRTASVSKLAEDVSDVAGIADELAHEIPKKMTEMARDMECAAGSAQAEHIDDGKTGHQFRGIAEWIRSTAQTTGVPVNALYLPAPASIYSDVKASLTEDAIQTVLHSMWKATGSKSRKTGFVGGFLKKRFRDFQFYLPSSTTTQSTSRVTMREDGTKSLGDTVDVYASDWGDLELVIDRWLFNENFGGSATAAEWYGYFLNTARWAWCWNQKPTVYKPEFKGGSYKAAIDALIMLLCLNPVGEGKVAPSDA